MLKSITIAKNSLILFLRLLVTSVIALFTSRIILKSLGASDYGLYNVVGGVVVMMAFLNTVMTTTSFRFIAYEMGRESNGQVNSAFNVSLIIHIFLALLLILFTETIGVFYVNNYLNVDSFKISDALFVLRLSTYSMVFSVISIPFMGLITAKENFITQSIIEVVRSFLTLFVALAVFYLTGNKLRIYTTLLAIANTVSPLLYISYCYFKYKEIVRWRLERNLSKYKEMLSFSGWILLGAAASLGQTTGSSLIINSFFGTSLNAAFGIANQVNILVLMFAKNLNQAAIPQITKSFSGGDTDRSVKLTAYISKYTVFLMLIPSLPFLLETNYILSIWLEGVPQYTSAFTKLMIINSLLQAIGGVAALAQASGRIRLFQIILSTTTLISLPIAYLLYNIGYDPTVISYAFITTTIINVVVSQILLKRIMNYNVLFYIKTAYFRVIYVISFVLPLFLIKSLFDAGLVRFLVMMPVSIIWLLITIYFVGLDSEEKVNFKMFMSNFHKNIISSKT